MKQLALGLSDPPQRARADVLRSAHVRSHMTVAEAVALDGNAVRQERAILLFFRLRPDERVTPSAVHAWFRQWPLTSVRRSLSNLTERGHLLHHPEDRRPGPYGAKESTWSLA